MKIAAIIAGTVLVVLALRFRPPAAEPAFTVARASATPAAFAARSPLAHHAPATPAPIVVYVTGAVAHPGLVTLPSGARADLAVRHAGGLLPTADPAAVNLAAHLTDGEEIVVPRAGEPPTTTPRSRRSARSASAAARRSHAPSTAARKRSRGTHATPPAQAININSATVDSLAAIPGISTRLAERIIEFRDLNGPFDSLDELADIEGITATKLDTLAPYITL